MSGAAVSTRGRYMTPEERGRNPGLVWLQKAILPIVLQIWLLATVQCLFILPNWCPLIWFACLTSFSVSVSVLSIFVFRLHVKTVSTVCYTYCPIISQFSFSFSNLTSEAIFRIHDIIESHTKTKGAAAKFPAATIVPAAAMPPQLRPRLAEEPAAAPPPLMSLNTQPAGVWESSVNSPWSSSMCSFAVTNGAG
jgi:hypothetical protein